MINLKILLIFPAVNKYAFGKDWRETESLLPPLGLLYLATPLIKKGHLVSLIDLNVDNISKQDFINNVKLSDFILISCFTEFIDNTKKLIEDVKKYKKKDAKIICGGPHCTLLKEQFTGSDYTVIGEAEQEIVKLVESIYYKKNLDEFPGLIYKVNGKTVKNPGFMKAENINESELPALELIRGKDYGKIAGLKLKIAPILSTRGCPYSCTYCTFKLIKYRERSVKSVTDELKTLADKGYKYIFFCDDNFLLKKDRAHKIMDYLIKNKIKLKLIFQARVDTADYDLYKKLSDAGATVMLFGIENANQDVLDFYEKRTTVKQIENAVRIANSVGIMTIGFMMFGSPVETEKHFIENKKFFKRVPLDLISSGVLTYMIGTKIWQDAYKKGLLKKSEFYVRADKSRRLSNYSYEELVKKRDEFAKSFYSDPKRIVRIMAKAIRHGLIFGVIKAFLKNNLLKASTTPFVAKDPFKKYSKKK